MSLCVCVCVGCMFVVAVIRSGTCRLETLPHVAGPLSLSLSLCRNNGIALSRLSAALLHLLHLAFQHVYANCRRLAAPNACLPLRISLQIWAEPEHCIQINQKCLFVRPLWQLAWSCSAVSQATIWAISAQHFLRSPLSFVWACCQQ